MRIDALRAGLAALLIVPAAAAQHGVPGNAAPKLDPTEDVPPAYGETLRQRAGQQLERARREGRSFIAPLQGSGAAPAELPPAADFSARPPPPARPAPEPPPPPPYETIREAAGTGNLADLLAALLEAWNEPPSFARLRYPEPDAGPPPARPPPPAPPGAAPPEIRPGAALFARALYEINSDYPGPVVLEILEPPLAGAVATGGFETVRDRMTLRLTSLSFRGARFPVDAWAVGLDCACFGVDAERDRHWISRALLPAAFRFAEGFLTSRARPDETVHLPGGDVVAVRGAATARDDLYAGLGRSARSVGDILLEDAPKRPTVRIPRNTELAVMFASPPASARAGASRRPAPAPSGGPELPRAGSAAGPGERR